MSSFIEPANRFVGKLIRNGGSSWIDGANNLEVGVWRVGVEVGEVVGIPELGNLFVRAGFRNAAQSIFFHSPCALCRSYPERS